MISRDVIVIVIIIFFETTGRRKRKKIGDQFFLSFVEIRHRTFFVDLFLLFLLFFFFFFSPSVNNSPVSETRKQFGFA